MKIKAWMLAGAMLLTTVGCSSTQCVKAQRLFDAANAGYASAAAAGKTGKMDQYKWAADSAEAMLMMWCAGITE